MAGLFTRLAEAAALRVATRAQAGIVKHFEVAGADKKAKAIAYDAPDKASARSFERMAQFGVFPEAGQGTGKYWLDARALAAFRKEELGRVIGAVAVAGLAAAGAMALGR